MAKKVKKIFTALGTHTQGNAQGAKPSTQEVLTEICAVTGSLRFTNRPKNPARFNHKKK